METTQNIEDGKEYVLLQSLTSTPIQLSINSRENRLQIQYCLECKQLKRNKPFPEKFVVENRPVDIPLNFIRPAHVAVIKESFLSLLKIPDIDSWLEFGKIHSENNKEIKGFLAFRGKNLLYTRGGAESTLTFCSKCKNAVYLPDGRNYISAKLPEEIPVFENQLWGLVIKSLYYKNIEQCKFKKLYIERVRTNHKPRDNKEFQDIYLSNKQL